MKDQAVTTRLYVLWVPTIITSEITDVTIQDIISNGSFALRNSQNLPWSYSNNLPDGQSISDISTAFTWSESEILFDGTEDSLLEAQWRAEVWRNLYYFYQWSNVSELTWHEEILNIDPDDTVRYVDWLIKKVDQDVQNNELESIPACSSFIGWKKYFSLNDRWWSPYIYLKHVF